MSEGDKHDQDKARWDLLPMRAVSDIVNVLTYGAKKYAPNNWRKVEDARARYYAAALRHLIAWWMGEERDKESGLPHLAHAGCCLIFLSELGKDPGKIFDPPTSLREVAEELEREEGAGPAKPAVIHAWVCQRRRRMNENEAYIGEDGHYGGLDEARLFDSPGTALQRFSDHLIRRVSVTLDGVVLDDP